MGRESPVGVASQEQCIQESKPESALGRGSQLVFSPNRVNSAACSDGTTHQPSKSVIVIKDKEYDTNNYSKASDSGSFVGEESTAKHAISSDMRSTTFCSENLPICGAPDSVTLPDDIELSAKEVFCLHLGDDLPNEPALFIGRRRLSSSQEDWEMYCQTCRVLGRTFFSPRAACFASYLDPKSAKVPVKQCPYGQQTNSRSSQTESGGGGSNQGTFVTGYGGASSSHLVTGLGRFGGGGGGDDDPLRPRPVKLTPSHYAEFAGYEEEQPMDSQRRLLVTTTPEEILAAPMAFFGCSDNHSPCDATGTTPPASYFMDEIAVTPIEQSNSDIGDSFDLIRLMSRLQTRTPTTPQQQSTLGFLPGPFSSPPSPSPSTPLPLSPVTPLNPSPVTPIPSPAPVSPQVTTTPQQASASGPARLFHPKTYVTDDERVCELYVPQDLPQESRDLPLRALFHSAAMYSQIAHCMEQPCDLKVATDTRANLCKFDFDHEQLKLVFSMPKECKPLGEWLEENQDSINVRDRLLILQQVMNTLAAIHTLGNEELLCLWGAFMVWVAPDMRVYLLVDFPELFRKQQVYASRADNVNPRVEDVMAVQQLYGRFIQPYICYNSCWTSPGVQQMFIVFESLLSDPSCWSKMAELARTLGEKRVCKLEVDLETLPVDIYCLEQEALQSSLQPLRGIAPAFVSRWWMVRWLHSGRTVQRTDVATADRRMQLGLIPVNGIEDNSALYITSDYSFL